jgi:hypothetical protein
VRAEAWLHAFLTSALDGGEWSASRPDRFNLGACFLHCLLFERHGRRHDVNVRNWR